jgi:hypothetical protein
LISFCLFLSRFGCSSKEARGLKVKYINPYKSRNFDELENFHPLQVV